MDDLHEEQAGKPVVLVVTNTSCSEVIASWHDELRRRGCDVQATNKIDCLECCGNERLRAVLLDDVEPAGCREGEQLLMVLVSIHPLLRIVLLATGDEGEIERLKAGLRGHERVVIHPHGQLMETCFDYLAGKLQGEQIARSDEVVLCEAVV